MKKQNNLKPDPKLKDFRNFLYVIWKHLRLPQPTAVQYDIADYLQSDKKRIVIQGFRGVGKSWITSAFCLHQLYLDPQKNILVVSASKSRSDDFSTFCLRLLNEVPILHHLMPDDSQRQSKISFDVAPALASHQPSVKSVGIFGQLTGSRADVIIGDDVETATNSITQGMRSRLSEAVKEFEAIIKPNGRIIFLGTPQTESSLYNEIVNQRGYILKTWTARYPNKKQLTYLANSLAPLIKNAVELDPSLEGKSVENSRFSDKDLAERELSYGRSQFNLQFMLDTTLSDSDRYPLKLSDLMVTSLNPERAYEKYVWSSNPEQRHNELPCVGMAGDFYYRPMDTVGDLLEYSGSVMAIDPSGRGKDETSWAVCKFLNGQIFVFDCGGMRGGFEEVVLVKLVKIAKKHKVNEVIVESNFGGGAFTELLKPWFMKEYPVTINEVRNNIQKEKRIIDVVEPILSGHKIIVDEKVVQSDYSSTQSVNESEDVGILRQLFYQMSRLTRDKGSLSFDDRLDALSMAIGYWVDQISRDADRAIYDRKNDLLNEELEKFMEQSTGYKPKGMTWI